MLRIKILKLTFVLILPLFGCVNNSPKMVSKRDINFNSNWKYIRNSFESPEQINFDDARWKTVHLPHDISIEDCLIQDSLHIGPFY